MKIIKVRIGDDNSYHGSIRVRSSEELASPSGTDQRLYEEDRHGSFQVRTSEELTSSSGTDQTPKEEDRSHMNNDTTSASGRDLPEGGEAEGDEEDIGAGGPVDNNFAGEPEETPDPKQPSVTNLDEEDIINPFHRYIIVSMRRDKLGYDV